MTDYQSIECVLHSQYELAIMHQQKITLHWRDAEDNIYDDILLPIDLTAKNGEEFLIAKADNGKQYKIRLDRILQHDLFAPL